MEKDFVQTMNFEKTKKYEPPVIITISGKAGSGKTTLAYYLSENLKVYLISNDYIRQYLDQTGNYINNRSLREDKLKDINQKRIEKLINNRISFIYDRDFNLLENFQKLEDMANGYKFIKIRINSIDEENIQRIVDRQKDFNKELKNVIGDNIMSSNSFNEETYYIINERKPQTLEDNFFDYIIDNTGSLDYFKEQIVNIINDIELKSN